MKSVPDRTGPPPAAGELRPVELPGLEMFELEGGLEVWVAEHRELPEVSLRLIVGASATADPEDREGIAELTGRLLTEGSEDLSAMHMAEWQDRIGAGFQVAVGYDTCLISMHLLSEVLEEGLDYLRDAVLRPALAPEEVDRVRSERLDEIERDLDKPDVVADLALIRAIYGRHRYGRPTDGVPETVEGLDAEAVRDFHRRRYSSRGAALVVCGDISAAELEERLRPRFGGWTAGKEETRVAPAPTVAEMAGRVLVCDRPGGAQSEIRVGAVGAPRDADDYYDIVVANSILGGLFNSRVNMNLREDKGWTYGARTAFRFRRAAGPFVGSAAVDSDVTAEAFEEFLREVRGMAESPPTDREIRLAKNALTLSLPRRFETPSQISRKISTRLVYGLPDDYWERYRERIEAVTREGILRVAERYLQPESFVLVVAADADRVTPGLERRFEAVEAAPDL